MSCIALALGRALQTIRALVCRLGSQMVNSLADTFGRQALPMVWDFCEVDPVLDFHGWISRSRRLGCADVVEAWPRPLPTRSGRSAADATSHPLARSRSASVWFTDPPYYDAVPYADLSDFFFVWLKRALPGHPLSSRSL